LRAGRCGEAEDAETRDCGESLHNRPSLVRESGSECTALPTIVEDARIRAGALLVIMSTSPAGKELDMNRRRALVVVAAVAALATAGISLATVGTNQAEQFVADFDLAAVKPPVIQTCAGPDGTYQSADGTYKGAVTSTVPLLSGRMRLTLHSLINLDKGLGSATGSWRIVDADTGNEEARGTLQGLFPAGNELHAFVVGQASDSRAVLGELNAFTDEGRTEYVGRIGHLTPSNRALLLPAVSCG
jgi:hypothetical protein